MTGGIVIISFDKAGLQGWMALVMLDEKIYK